MKIVIKVYSESIFQKNIHNDLLRCSHKLPEVRFLPPYWHVIVKLAI